MRCRPIGLRYRTKSGELNIVTELVLNAGQLGEAELQSNSESFLDLHQLLLHSTSGPALDRLILRGFLSVAEFGGALECQCSVEDCRAVVGIVSL